MESLVDDDITGDNFHTLLGKEFCFQSGAGRHPLTRDKRIRRPPQHKRDHCYLKYMPQQMEARRSDFIETRRTCRSGIGPTLPKKPGEVECPKCNHTFSINKPTHLKLVESRSSDLPYWWASSRLSTFLIATYRVIGCTRHPAFPDTTPVILLRTFVLDPGKNIDTLLTSDITFPASSRFPMTV
jgi:hypothetical protein